MPRFVLLMVVGGWLLLAACQTEPAEQPTSPTPTAEPVARVNVPTFNADSAYAYVQRQVDFGPRNPGSKGHKQCADWLEQTFNRWADTVIVQHDKVKDHNGKMLPMYNLIASFRPEQKERILLCAHWDTRPNADRDTARQTEPILGANDGGSGVGVLLEIARQLKATPANVGVDIILFDVEDGGDYGIDNSFCLGSQYWSKKTHVPNYAARFGILLDMVGAGDALFLPEQHSLKFARPVVQKVWQTAAELGYGSLFVSNIDPRYYPTITDDHYYVNTNARIPTIDIIHYTTEGSFGSFWHTHRDNMNAVSKSTLGAVGSVVMTVVYREQADS